MKKIAYFELISNLFEFKTISDGLNNEFVVFKQSPLDVIDNVVDKTEFEALENHVHLIDNIKKNEHVRLMPIAERLGNALLCSLKINYPIKHFVVFVSLSDSMIIRFHQKWENEKYYYNQSDFMSGKEKVLMFES